MQGAFSGHSEILHVADAVAREKSIDKEQVLEAMELAIQKAGRAKYGYEHDIRAVIDRKTGEIQLTRYREVVEEIENEATQVLLIDAKYKKEDAELGDFIVEELPPIEFGRIAAQTAKQVIVQKVRDAERQRQYEEYADKVGQIVNGVVKRTEFNNIIVDIGRTEAVITKDQMIPREAFQNGDRVRAHIMQVKRAQRGPQIFLSRTSAEFMSGLFAAEVPEIYDGLIEIKSVARDPGSRAKIAVFTEDKTIDPIGACVGMRGSRVQAVVNELQGEKIDIVHWDPNMVTFVINSLAPAEIAKVIVDEDAHKIEVVVPEASLSLAIGRRGQNVRLASQLTHWDLDILTEDQESERRQEEFKLRSEAFMLGLDVDEIIAQLLVAEGFARIDDIANSENQDLASIEGFDENIAEEIITRAKTYIEEHGSSFADAVSEQDLAVVDFLPEEVITLLKSKGIETLDALADLATDELIEVIGEETNITEETAEEIIMRAREHWFQGD